MDNFQKFWAELKERNVVKVFIFYCVASWLIIQVVDVLIQRLNLPDKIGEIVIYSLLIGLPIVVVGAWIYELTSEGLKKTTAVPKGKFTKRTGRILNNGIIAVLSVAVLLLLVDKFVVSDEEAPILSETDALAIFPFKVQGSDQSYQTLVPQLMTGALDLIPELNATDQSVLLTELGDDIDGTFSPEEAGKVAAKVGANRFVLGDISALGQRLQIKLTTYDAQGTALGSPIVEVGKTDRLEELVYRTAQKLSADELERKGSEFNSSAILTAKQIEAIPPFLESTKLIQEGKYDEALEQIRLSIEYDSTFVLAYAKYIEIAGWLQLNSDPELRQSEFLPNLYRLQELSEQMKVGKLGELVAARIEFEKADIRAERNYYRLLNKYGESTEILMGLAESLFHQRELVAGDVKEAKQHLERLLEIDSTNKEVLLHLFDIAIMEGQEESANKYLSRIEESNVNDLNREIQLLTIKDTVSDAELQQIANLIEVGEFEFRIKPAMRQIEGLNLLDRMMSLDPVLEDAYFDFFVKAKFSSTGKHKALVDIIVDELSYYEVGEEPDVYIYSLTLDDGLPDLRFFDGHEDVIINLYLPFVKNPDVPILYDLIGQYLVGSMYLAKGDRKEFSKITKRLLDFFDDYQDSSVGPVSDLSRMFYYNLKGFESHYDKDFERSIVYFDSAVSEIREIDRNFAVSYAKPRNLFNAENHRLLNQYDDAKNLYRNLAESRIITNGASTGGATWGYLVYRLAQMHDQLNEPNEAAKYYAIFINAYKEADEKYLVWVDDAYKRLAVLLNKPESELRNSPDLL